MVEYWREFARISGCRVEFRLVDWNQGLEMIRRGEAHIHGGLFRNTERDQYMDFSTSLRLPLTTRLFVNKKLKVEGVAELDDISVGVIKGGFSQSYLRKNNPSVKMMEFPSASATIDAALSGKVMAFANEYPAAVFYLRKKGDLDQFYVAETLFRENLYAAVGQGNYKLLSFVNNVLAKIPEDFILVLTRKWYKPDPEIPGWVLPAVIGLAGAMLTGFVLFYIVMLKRQVAARTAELEQALSEVKTLGGLLPICAKCKKIRDDSGYWGQVEEYIAAHSEVTFSHSVCPDCIRQLYPEVADKILAEEELPTTARAPR